ncbi:MAG TPA: DUF6236 family protein [Pyrinomonadaceae bacterium]|jgi:Family of unknown function (DUF6236)|nr:DUF6236 family protein [Pyrinomonadaceae bacterium]
MSQETFGLYYPYIHFQDQDWLQRAALYWDKMGRIVPDLDDVNADDTDLVRALKNEVGFVEDLRPSKETDKVGSKFLTLLNTYEGQLRSHYGTHKWKHRLKKGGSDWNRKHDDEIVEQVYVEKMSRRLRQSLVDIDLAYAPIGRDFLLMHRTLADVYMTVLANAMAQKQYEPTTDNVINHYAVMGDSVEHIKHALLPSTMREEKTELPQPSLAKVAMFALKMNVPRNTDGQSVKTIVKRIVKFRQNHRESVQEFRADVAKFARNQRLLRLMIRNPEEFQNELEAAYNEKVQEKLENVNKMIKDVWKETAVGMLCVSPTALITKGLPVMIGAVEPISTTIGALALGTALVLRKNERDLKAKLGPEAYLLHAREYFEPASRSTRIKRWSRRFFFRI